MVLKKETPNFKISQYAYSFKYWLDKARRESFEQVVFWLLAHRRYELAEDIYVSGIEEHRI